MKKVILLFALMSALCVHSLSAQVIKGDMNDDSVMDISDVSESVNTLLGKRPIQYVQGGDPYMVDNNRIAGTWYRTKNDSFTLNADGTTDYPGAETYRYYPYQGRILFFDSKGALRFHFNLILVEDGMLVVTRNESPAVYIPLYATKPDQKVTSIQLSQTSMDIFLNESSPLPSVTVLPSDADNKSVTWSSSNESVARVEGDLVFAVAEGTAVITCCATDGSGVKAECTVSVNAAREYVDLGLPGGVLWATCNIGADKPEDYGLYFAWGETKGYTKGESHSFDWEIYKWCNGDESKMTKYSTSTSYWDPSLGTSPDGKTVLDSEDDAATANRGAGWRMPTLQEINDLYNSAYTTSEWVTVNGVKGRKITSKSNGNSIFLPAAGYRSGTGLYNEGTYGNYWSSSLYTDSCDNACSLYYHSADVFTGDDYRYYGFPVRPVRVSSE